jgi:hypothetical protein
MYSSEFWVCIRVLYPRGCTQPPYYSGITIINEAITYVTMTTTIFLQEMPNK